jgi:hypothetical protein
MIEVPLYTSNLVDDLEAGSETPDALLPFDLREREKARRSYLEVAERTRGGIEQDFESTLDPLLPFSSRNVQKVM